MVSVKESMASTGPYRQYTDQPNCECDREQEFLYGWITLDSSTKLSCHTSITRISAFHRRITNWLERLAQYWPTCQSTLLVVHNAISVFLLNIGPQKW